MPGQRGAWWTLVLMAVHTAVATADESSWWNSRWRFRTTVAREIPCRHEGTRVVEVAPDFYSLLRKASIAGTFDPRSLRVVERGKVRPLPFVFRAEPDPGKNRPRPYLAWMTHCVPGKRQSFDIYFETTDRNVAAAGSAGAPLPPENLVVNPSFEQLTGDRVNSWEISPAELVRWGRFEHTTGTQSLKIVVDEHTAEKAPREVTLSQRVDVRDYAGQEMVFQCDLLAQRAAYGAPVSIELEQYRADGSRIAEYAVQPRWLTLELAQGQRVQFCQRGRFSHEAASVQLRIRLHCYVSDADTRGRVTGPESFFTVWLDRVVIRPGQRWSWPPRSHAGFVPGAIEQAPFNRALELAGQRCVAFNGASEGTLTRGQYNADPNSVHWGLGAGTLELWCQPKWDSSDGREHTFFHGIAYGHRLQSRLRKLDGRHGNRLEFTIADAGGTLHSVGGSAILSAGRWYHLAATWDFPKSHLQLFVDGKIIAHDGPEDSPWPSSLVAKGARSGIGIMENDSRSLPMQAFIGNGPACDADSSAEAVVDELRISSIARYHGSFTPTRAEFPLDEHTRALFHFENEVDGIHSSDDRRVTGHLACELSPVGETVALDVFEAGSVRRQQVVVQPAASPELFESNRAESRLVVTRPFRELPDPRFVEYRSQVLQHTVTGRADELQLEVHGDCEPLMIATQFRHADDRAAQPTALPRWRANENVVPFSFAELAATLAPQAKSDADKAFEVFKYALATSNYYDAHVCETLPCRHRKRIAYTLIKALNIYPFDQCGPLNYTLRKLMLAAGISSNDASGTHHQFEQAFYDGDLRLFDLSPRVYWLARDNRTVISRRDFEEDLYLKLRQESSVGSALPGRASRARFGVPERPHSMSFTLQPGERVSVCWHNEGRWIEIADDRRPIPLAKIPPMFGNGAIVYEPCASETARENLVVDQSEDGPGLLRARDAAKPASLIYQASAPYIFTDACVTGTARAGQDGVLRLSISLDQGKSWVEVWRNRQGTMPIAVSLKDRVLGHYCYQLKLSVAKGGGAQISGLGVRTTFVVSPLSLPGRLALGANRIRFVGGPVTTPVKTCCRWVERHRSDLGVALDSTRYYMDDDRNLRNVFVARPGQSLRVQATVHGRKASTSLSLHDLPEGWTASPASQHVEVADAHRSASAAFSLRPGKAEQGQVQTFALAVREGDHTRRVAVQVLHADAPLRREAEQADEKSGSVVSVAIPALSGSAAVHFTGKGQLSFGTAPAESAVYALWLRARWEPDCSTEMRLTIDGQSPRRLSAMAMIGFTDWTNPRYAHTKMFAHFGEQYGHWSWYRIPDIKLSAGAHTLTLGAKAGAWFDALLLLPQNPTMDRAAMNLFQNANYAPWDNPQ